jgi:hypothetical protein
MLSLYSQYTGKGIRGETKVSSVLLADKTGLETELMVDAVFVAIGLQPENEIFASQTHLKMVISRRGRIAKQTFRGFLQRGIPAQSASPACYSGRRRRCGGNPGSDFLAGAAGASVAEYKI